MSEQNLQLCEGAYYRNRRGEKIGPMYKGAFSQEPSWKVQGERFSLTHHSDGRVSLAGKSDWDLIEFWPAPEQPAAESADPGEGWRLLAHGEVIQEGDEERIGDGAWNTSRLINCIHGAGCYQRRRRDPAPAAESVPSVDLREHELSELRKANAELLKANTWKAIEINNLRGLIEKDIEKSNEIVRERDKLKAACIQEANYSAKLRDTIKDMQSQLAALQAKPECRVLVTIGNRTIDVFSMDEELDRLKKAGAR
jgi:hypothetical protein